MGAFRVMVTAAMMAAGCGDENCDQHLPFQDQLTQAAPNAQLLVTTDNCSTCDHANLQVIWSGPTAGVTGTIDVEVHPACFVQPYKLSRPATGGVGDYVYDWNTKNCGDQVDYSVVAINRSNVTMDTFEVHVNCIAYEPKM